MLKTRTRISIEIAGVLERSDDGVAKLTIGIPGVLFGRCDTDSEYI